MFSIVGKYTLLGINCLFCNRLGNIGYNFGYKVFLRKYGGFKLKRRYSTWYVLISPLRVA
jgi:hypothetical protein